MLIVTTQATGAEPQTDRAPLPGKIGDAAQIAAMKPRRSSPTCWTTRRRPTCPAGDVDLFCAITHFFDKELRRYEGQNALGNGSTKLPDNGASLNRRDSLFVSRLHQKCGRAPFQGILLRHRQLVMRKRMTRDAIVTFATTLPA